MSAFSGFNPWIHACISFTCMHISIYPCVCTFLVPIQEDVFRLDIPLYMHVYLSHVCIYPYIRVYVHLWYLSKRTFSGLKSLYTCMCVFICMHTCIYPCVCTFMVPVQEDVLGLNIPVLDAPAMYIVQRAR